MKRIIYLQKVGNISQDILNKLKRNIEQTLSKFDILLKINPVDIKLQNTEFNSRRVQYKAAKILKNLNKMSQDIDTFRALGVIDEDIYTKNFNYIFGSASMNSGVALISLTRLRERFYTDRGSVHRPVESEEVLDERILKEAIHELGHTFGLPHCKNNCFMQFSNSLVDTDNKPKEFCESCFSNLEDFFNDSNLNY